MWSEFIEQEITVWKDFHDFWLNAKIPVHIIRYEDILGEPKQTMMKLMRMPPDARLAMGERARRHVAEHFSLEAVLDRWERLYAELLERKHAHRRIGAAAWEIFRRRSAHTA